MALYRVRAQAQPGHGGFYRAGKFWSSSAWTTIELTEREADRLRDEPRLIVELGAPDLEKAKDMASEALAELKAEKKAHGKTKEVLEAARATIGDLTHDLAAADRKLDVALAELDELKSKARADAKAAAEAAKKAEADAKVAAKAEAEKPKA